MRIHWTIEGGFEIDQVEIDRLVADGINLKDGKAVADALEVDYMDAIHLPIDVWTSGAPR